MGNKIKLTESQLKGLVTRVTNKLLAEEKKFSVIDNAMLPTNYGEVVGNTLPDLYDNLQILMRKHGVQNFDFKIASDGLANVVFIEIPDMFMEKSLENLRKKYPELIFYVQKDKQGYYFIALRKRMSNGTVADINSLRDTTGKSGIRTLEGWAEIYYKHHNLTPQNNITESKLFESGSLWNDLIKIRDQYKPGDDVYEKASMYLRQLNTAGGKNMIGGEVESFIDETDTLSLEQLKQKYPEIKFTMNKKGQDRYFVRADIETQGGEMEYLGALKGFVDEKKALKFLNNTAKGYYDKYY